MAMGGGGKLVMEKKRRRIHPANDEWLLTTQIALPTFSAVTSHFTRNPMDVSNQLPQLHPPPPSGTKYIPQAGIEEIQQSERRRGKRVSVLVFKSHSVISVARRKRALDVQT